jgi:hypothetical protein
MADLFGIRQKEPETLTEHEKRVAAFFQDAEADDILFNLESAWSKGNLHDMKEGCLLILNKALREGHLSQPLVPTNRLFPRYLAQSPFSGAPSFPHPEVHDSGHVKDRAPVAFPAIDPKTGRVKERLPAANVEALGRSLFTDYLVPVLAAGVLLLVATIGAIVIAGRRGEVLR